MVTDADLPVEERLFQLFQHLGIERAHVAGHLPQDWSGLATAHPEVIASLTLICPRGIEPEPLRPLASRLLTFGGDQGPLAEMLDRVMSTLPEARHVSFRGGAILPWTNVVNEWREEIGAALVDFLGQIDQRQGVRPARLPEEEGEMAGITYRIRGTGPPLVLLPLALAPSQWEPLLPQLSRRYCTLTLGGTHLGAVSILEARGGAPGYRRLWRNLVDEVHLEPGETILEVGCGSGALLRWLARHTGGANRIVGIDINGYLLRKAAALAQREGLEGAFELREGNAESLPLPDDSFDVTLSSTVMEEVDADRMLAEMVRLTKPGGRVAVIVRAVDLPWVVDLPLRPELRAKVEAPGGTVGERGCADAGLYRRFRQVGLTGIQRFPQLATFDSRIESRVLVQPVLLANKALLLSLEEAGELRAAVARAEAEGTLWFAQPHHAAVGTKP